MSPSIFEGTQIANLWGKVDKNEIIKKAILKFKQFLKKYDVTVLNNKSVKVEQVVQDYFDMKAPSGESEAKKYEFPDAIMIAKIKIIFSNSNTMPIISGDDKFRESFDNNKQAFRTYASINSFLGEKTKKKEQYRKVLSYLESSDGKFYLETAIKDQIKDSGVEVNGISYNRKGLSDGFDNNKSEIQEIKIYKINNFDITLDEDTLIDRKQYF